MVHDYENVRHECSSQSQIQGLSAAIGLNFKRQIKSRYLLNLK